MAKELRKKQDPRAPARPDPHSPTQPSSAQRSSTKRRSSRSPGDAPPTDLGTGVALAVFALITLTFFSGHLFGGQFLWEDFAEFTYPNEVFAARSFAAGILPYWNPFTFNGMPFLADLQIGYFYPGNLLMYIVAGGELGSWLAQLFVILHFPIAMYGAWKLSRGLGIGGWGALFSGVAYGLSGILVAHMIHPNMLFHLAWFPLIVHLFRRGVEERSWMHALLTGLLLGIVMLSGHPQSALYIVFFLFALTVVVLIRDLRTREHSTRALVTSAVCALVPIALAAGIFAVQLLPSQELAGLSERATMTYDKSLEGSMSPGQIFTLVVPKVFGVAGANPQPDVPFWLRPEIYYYWETAIYAGVVTLLLAIVALAARSMRTIGWFFGAMALLGVLYGLGDSFFVHPVLARVPLFDTFRSPARLAMYLALGAAVLAGAGLDRLLRSGTDDARLSRTALIAGGVIAGIGLLTVAGVLPSMLGAPPELAGAVGSTGTVALLVGGAAAVLAWMRLKGRIAGTIAAVLFILLGAIDLYVFGMTQNASSVDPQEIYERNDVQFAAFRAKPPDTLFRVRMREAGGMLMQRNQGPYSGIMLFEGYNPLLLERRVPPAYDPEKAFDFMNIRYSAKVDSQAQALTVVERPSAYAHARMLYDVRVLSTEGVLASLKDRSIDFGRTVLLETDPGIRTDGSGTGTARFVRYDASELELDVQTDKPGILVLSEVWYPAWKVEVDGKPAALLQANYSLRGVALQPGRHRVRMRYESDAFATGKWVTIGSLVIALSGIAAAFMRRRNRRDAKIEST